MQMMHNLHGYHYYGMFTLFLWMLASSTLASVSNRNSTHPTEKSNSENFTTGNLTIENILTENSTIDNSSTGNSTIDNLSTGNSTIPDSTVTSGWSAEVAREDNDTSPTEEFISIEIVEAEKQPSRDSIDYAKDILIIPKLRYIRPTKMCSDIFWKFYSKENMILRPLVENESTTYITMSVYLTELEFVDEPQHTLGLTVGVNVNWLDHRVKWDLERCNMTHDFLMAVHKLWYPQIVMDNIVEDAISVDSWDPSPILVFYSGAVRKTLFRQINLACHLDISRFPKDVQYCFIVFRFLARVGFRNVSDLAAKTNLNITGNMYWTVNKNLTMELVEGTENMVKMHFSIARRSESYIYTLYAPTLGLAPLPVLAFVVPSDSGEKLTVSITALLTYAVIAISFFASIPISGSIPNIGVLFLYLMMSTVLSTFGSAIVLRLAAEDRCRLYKRADKANYLFLVCHIILNIVVPVVMIFLDIYTDIMFL